MVKARLCKWKYGKQSAVMFMIDDFANKYMTDINQGDYLGSDWGGRCLKENSMQRFIEEKLMESFPYLCITYFLVTGKRAGVVNNGNKSYTESIIQSKDFVMFLQEMCNNPHYEIAYHGVEHGAIIGDQFIQEWELFRSVDEAKKKIDEGKRLFLMATGERFWGGKYCGYKSNSFSDQSISESGFLWWCRKWDFGSMLVDSNWKTHRFELEMFNNSTVDIPSNVDGSFCSLKDIRILFSKMWRKYLRSIYFFVKYGLTIERYLDNLVNNSSIINIQEHSSPKREDKIIQSPNVIDDISTLKYILTYLKKYDLWYATGREIADYYRCYSNTVIERVGNQLKLKQKKYIGDYYLWMEFFDCETPVALKDKEGNIINGITKNNRMLFELQVPLLSEYTIVEKNTSF